MFDPSSLDLNALLAQAQAMQNQLEAAQADLANKTVSGSAGGGLVEATLTGTGELVALKISPEACDPADTETLADLIVAAVRDANHQAMALAQATMPPIPELGL
jgi:DNA-binding protein, YbaB/EbfC family